MANIEHLALGARAPQATSCNDGATPSHDGTPFAFAFQAGHRPAVDRAPCQFHIACNPEKVGFPGNDAHGSGTVGPSLRTRLQTDGANVWGKPSVSQVDHER